MQISIHEYLFLGPRDERSESDAWPPPAVAKSDWAGNIIPGTKLGSIFLRN